MQTTCVRAKRGHKKGGGDDGKCVMCVWKWANEREKKYAYMTFLVGHIVRYIANFSDSIVHGVII